MNPSRPAEQPGASLQEGGVAFVVDAGGAEAVELCLFDADGAERRLEMAPGGEGRHSIFVPDVAAGQRYGYRTQGSWDPGRGLFHDPAKLLLDPFARAVAGYFTADPAVHSPGVDSAGSVPRGVVVAAPPRPRHGPAIPWAETVVYETHVRGLTKTHPDVPPELAGTYLGAASPPVVEHLKALGVTTVELMPVAHHVDEPFLQRRGLTNYWGYSTLAWFAPHGGYATADDGRQVAEFAAMVDAFHAAGLEVMVDVVFNHTAEGGSDGPVLGMKGLDCLSWYRWDGGFVDWTGTGNTVATSHPATRAAIVAALRWWVEGLGVDGFRFDLGVTLGRGDDGVFDPAHLEWLASDPVVGGCKLVAEPWDLGPNGFRLGQFGEPWREWNGAFRDDVRDVWRGAAPVASLTARVDGSPDLFTSGGTVNFVTAHDGFTLADLVAYDRKHNEANGEQNRDGHDDNRSWNSGVEGPTDDPAVLDLRRRRASALLATLLLAAGVPMVAGGDELGRTQAGNNNAYAVDGPPAWYDWSEAPWSGHVGRLADLRRRYPVLRETGGRQWSDHGGALRMDVAGLVVAFNPTPSDVVVGLPPGRWRVEVDSAVEEAAGLYETDATISAWSVVVFVEE